MVAKKVFAFSLLFNLISNSLQTALQDGTIDFPHYKVVITKEKISNADINDVSVQNSIIMTSALGQPFSCIIPNVPVEQERLEREKSQAKEEAEQDKQQVIDRGFDLLEPLGVNCIQFVTSHYWTYEYCHNQYIRQFHIEQTKDGKGVETSSYFLGFHPGLTQTEIKKIQKPGYLKKDTLNKSKRSTLAQLKNELDQPYLIQRWDSGTLCDITQKPRQVEVQYQCAVQASDRVTRFVEVSTCNYQLVISTPRLCKEMGLSKRESVVSHEISCRPIVPEATLEQERHYEQQLLLEQEHYRQEQLRIEQEEKERQERLAEEKRENSEINLMDKIAELTEQINQLKKEMISNKQPGLSLQLDEQGQLLSNPDLFNLIAGQFKNAVQKNNKKTDLSPSNEEKNHNNQQEAYRQLY